MAEAVSNVLYNSARWDGFDFRDGDIVIATPAKCGTTWTQRIVSLLVFDSPELHAPDGAHLAVARHEHATARRRARGTRSADAPPVHQVAPRTTTRCRTTIASRTSPWAATRATSPSRGAITWTTSTWTTSSARRIARGRRRRPRRDVAGRRAGHVGQRRPTGSGAGSRGDGDVGSADSSTTSKSFWDHRDEPNVVLLHYADLQRDLVGQMAYLADRLGIERSRERLEELAPVASFDAMKASAEQHCAQRRPDVLEEHRRLLPQRHERPVARNHRRRRGGRAYEKRLARSWSTPTSRAGSQHGGSVATVPNASAVAVLRQRPLGRLRLPRRRHHHRDAGEVRHDVDTANRVVAGLRLGRAAGTRWRTSRRGSTCSRAPRRGASPNSKRRPTAGSSRPTCRSTRCRSTNASRIITIGRDPARRRHLAGATTSDNMDMERVVAEVTAAVGPQEDMPRAPRRGSRTPRRVPRVGRRAKR